MSTWDHSGVPDLVLTQIEAGARERYLRNDMLNRGIRERVTTTNFHFDAARREERTSSGLSFRRLVAELTSVIGKKLVAYVGRFPRATHVEEWIHGVDFHAEARRRLQFTHSIVELLRAHDQPAVIQAWLTGVNPELGDKVPIRMLRTEDLSVCAPLILAAARAFIAHG